MFYQNIHCFLFYLRKEEVRGHGEFGDRKNGMRYSNNKELVVKKETPLIKGRS